MSITLNELVRDQIIAEGPQIEDPAQRERYVDSQINILSNVELLERISDAVQHGVRTQWLYKAGL
jgi:hypothetical protein